MATTEARLLCGKEDYEKHWDAAAFTREFYHTPTALVKWALPNLKAIFDELDVAENARLLDIGTGPTLSFLLQAGPKIRTIYVSDFQRQNLDVLEGFAAGKKDNALATSLRLARKIVHNDENGAEDVERLRAAIKGKTFMLNFQNSQIVFMLTERPVYQNHN